jgi:hypothetical protein
MFVYKVKLLQQIFYIFHKYIIFLGVYTEITAIY